MTTSTQWYLDAIERELADLPADERAELLEDLAAHFGEFADDDDLVSTLGDPVAYARELRDAAGLSASPPPEATSPSSTGCGPTSPRCVAPRGGVRSPLSSLSYVRRGGSCAHGSSSLRSPEVSTSLCLATRITRSSVWPRS